MAGADASNAPQSRSADWWANVLITVGCAVVALMLLKRGAFPARAAGASFGVGVAAAGGAGLGTRAYRKGRKPDDDPVEADAAVLEQGDAPSELDDAPVEAAQAVLEQGNAPLGMDDAPAEAAQAVLEQGDAPSELDDAPSDALVGACA